MLVFGGTAVLGGTAGLEGGAVFGGVAVLGGMVVFGGIAVSGGSSVSGERAVSLVRSDFGVWLMADSGLGFGRGGLRMVLGGKRLLNFSMRDGFFDTT
jgi:hypothetical protein